MQQEAKTQMDMNSQPYGDQDSMEFACMGRSPMFSFTHQGFREHCRIGGRKIARAKEVVQDQMEMNPTSSWDPVHMNVQHL